MVHPARFLIERGGPRVKMNNSSSDTLSWIQERIKTEEINKYLDNSTDFINEDKIFNDLTSSANPDPKQIKDILQKSLAVESLSLKETALLLNVSDPAMLEKMKETAVKVKKKVYDNRIVTFAPLYLGNKCVNSCLYCGFNMDYLYFFEEVFE